MDYLMYNELAGWSHSKSCSQWLDIKVENSDEQCSSGLVLKLALFDILVSDMDCGIKCILSEFADDTELCAVVNMLERRSILGGVSSITD